MPNGNGLWRRQPLRAADRAAIAALPPPNTSDPARLAQAADRATRALLRLHHVRVAAPTAEAGQPASSATSDRVEILAAALLAAGLVVGVAVARRLWRRGSKAGAGA